MRVLIVSALFACACAAPSGLFAHLPAAVHYSAITPVNPGDFQGALIDAKVQTEDYLRSVADKQRAAAEQVGVVAQPAAVHYSAIAPVNSGDLQGALIDAKVQTEDYLRSVADKQRAAAEQVGVVAQPAAVHYSAIAPVNSGDLQGALINAKVQTEDYLRSVAEKQRAAAEKLVVAPQPAAVHYSSIASANSGDLQAALVDAKVQTEDYLRSVADKQRASIEQAVVDTNEKVIEANSQVQEKAVENFWANEERKWQNYDAVQTAQAQLDGQIASTSDAVAKSVVVPAIKSVVAASPVVTSYSSYIYAPGVVAPSVVASEVSQPALKAALPEAPKEEKKEEQKTEEIKTEELKTDSVQIESANVKTAEAEKASEAKYVVGQTPLLTSFPLATLKFAPQPWAPVVASELKTFVPYTYGAHYVAPTVVKNVW